MHDLSLDSSHLTHCMIDILRSKLVGRFSYSFCVPGKVAITIEIGKFVKTHHTIFTFNVLSRFELDLLHGHALDHVES